MVTSFTKTRNECVSTGGEISYYLIGILIKAQFCGLKHTNKQGVI